MDENNEVNEVQQNENTNTGTLNEEKKLNICGLLSFIFSLVGLLILGLPLGIAAVILGIIGVVKFDSEKQKYKWMGIVGICVGALDAIFVLFSVIGTVSLFL